MSYCVSTMIGIRTGGVFSDKTDMIDLRNRISKVAKKLYNTENSPDINIENLEHCMSKELVGHKGAYVVIAGVFNYWFFEKASVFAGKLSQEFGTEVMLMSWDEERNIIQTQIFLNGKPLFEINENRLNQIIRRIL